MNNNNEILDKYFEVAKKERIDISLSKINDLVHNATSFSYPSLRQFTIKNIVNLKYIIMTTTLVTSLIATIFIMKTKQPPTNLDIIDKPERIQKSNIAFDEGKVPNPDINKNTLWHESNKITADTTENKTVASKPAFSQKKNILIIAVQNPDTLGKINSSENVKKSNTLNVPEENKNEKDEAVIQNKNDKINLTKNRGYDIIYEFNYNNWNWALIKDNGLFGFIDTTGKQVVNPIYKNIYRFDEFHKNWAMVEKDKKFGFIDTLGIEVVIPQYKSIYHFDQFRDGWAIVQKNKKYGFIDLSGQEIVKPVYDEIYSFGEYLENWALVKKDKKYGFINNSGIEIVKPELKHIWHFGDFKEEWAMVEKDRKYGFIDTSGYIVVNIIYDEINYFDEIRDGWMKVKRDGLEMFLDKNGKEVFD